MDNWIEYAQLTTFLGMGLEINPHSFKFVTLGSEWAQWVNPSKTRTGPGRARYLGSVREG